MLVPKPFICSGYAVNMFLLRHNGYHCILFTSHSLQTAMNRVYKHFKCILQLFCNILNTRQFAVESTYLHEASLSCAHSALHSLCLELQACLLFALEMA
jgi:hypothetical protein